MSTEPAAVTTSFKTDLDNTNELVRGTQMRLVLERGYRFHANRRLRLSSEELTLHDFEQRGEILVWLHCARCKSSHLVCEGLLADRQSDALVQLSNEHDGELVVHVSAASHAGVAEVLDRWEALLGDPEGPGAGEIKLGFATAKAHNAYNMRTRVISAPAWEDIAENYDEPVRRELARLQDLEPDGRGRLLLWRGQPGTGKTHAVRSLIRAWSQWCRPIYVTDPEQFFGGDQDYMLDLLVGTQDEERTWQLLILEDAGELIAVDARQTAGQALSRLLNVSDGLIGQSTNTLVLVTTNEDIGSLHPAVHRAGRCISDCEFAALPTDLANGWLARHDRSTRVERATTLAELYAMAQHVAPPRRLTFGFRGSADRG